MGDTLFTALRTIVSLAAVFGALWWLHRRITKGKGRLGAASRQRGRAIEVVARQGLGAKAGVAVVEAGGRRYLLGVTEHAVTVLDRFDADPPAAGGEPIPALTTGLVPLPPSFERELASAVQREDDAHAVLATVTAAVIVQEQRANGAPETFPILPTGPVFTTRRAARAAELARDVAPQPMSEASDADAAAHDEAAQEEFLRRIATLGGRPIPPVTAPAPPSSARPAAKAPSPSPLAGSMLHPDTWRQTVAAIRRLR